MKRNKKGFTLAELLIVVAIIAVLVSISIPIFTSQLEKSREAVDLANIRSAYAEVMMAAGFEDTEAKYTVDGTSLYKGGQRYEATVQLKQQKDGWQTDSTSLAIGDITYNSDRWQGEPTKDGTCRVGYDGSNAYVIFDGQGSSTPTTDDTTTDVTPSQGDAGSDQSKDDSQSKDKDNSGGKVNLKGIDLDDKLSEIGQNISVTRGTLYNYQDGKYVCLYNQQSDQWDPNYSRVNPNNNSSTNLYIKLEENPTVLTPTSERTYYNKNDSTEKGHFDNVQPGTLYKNSNGVYVMTYGTQNNVLRPEDYTDGTTGNWLKIENY